MKLLQQARLPDVALAMGGSAASSDKGVVTAASGDDGFARAFMEAISHHRHWDRTKKDMVPA